ncbi:unnamed protein product [Penicillium pancosmium]
MSDLSTKLGVHMELPPIPTPDRLEKSSLGPKEGHNTRYQCGKLDPGDDFRLEHLGILADLECAPDTSLNAFKCLYL